MKELIISHIDAFAKKPFDGNPTVVVHNASSMTIDEMKQFAREMNMSESVFVLPSDKADFRLKFFTPSGNDITFCGHATVGALTALCISKEITPQKTYKIETNAAVLSMQVNSQDGPSVSVSYDLPKIELVPMRYSINEFVDALDLPKEYIDMRCPLMLEKTNNYLYFAVKSLDMLGKLEIDQGRAKALAQKDGIIILSALTPSAFDSKNHIHTRGFGPLINIPEDPYTGSMQGGVVAYARQNGLIDRALRKVGSEQGHFIGRKGEAVVEVVHDNPVACRLHATGYFLYTAQMRL